MNNFWNAICIVADALLKKISEKSKKNQRQIKYLVVNAVNESCCEILKSSCREFKMANEQLAMGKPSRTNLSISKRLNVPLISKIAKFMQKNNNSPDTSFLFYLE